jgi:tripartite-type tricarboxylate transporter receptor subunit TctC
MCGGGGGACGATGVPAAAPREPQAMVVAATDTTNAIAATFRPHNVTTLAMIAVIGRPDVEA